MERLTGRDAYGDIVADEEMLILASRDITNDDLHSIINHLAEKLCEYEDLEEQGRLVKLPCKVGDTVYKADKVREKIKQYKVIHFETDRVDFDNYDSCFLSQFGKTVFLTKEEAEAELNLYLKKYNKDVERM